MCNLYRLEKAHDATRRLAQDLGKQLEFPEGIPNFQPRAEIRITDRAPIMRAGQTGTVELIERRWSWPGPGGRPLYNFRSEGRRFYSGRCLILADGFYEFTPHSDPKSKRKHRWLFTLRGHDWFAIAGIWRAYKGVGEAFTMLTHEPSPDVAPYHHRSVAVLPPPQWARWLDHGVPASELLVQLAAGSLAVEQVN